MSRRGKDDSAFCHDNSDFALCLVGLPSTYGSDE